MKALSHLLGAMLALLCVATPAIAADIDPPHVVAKRASEDVIAVIKKDPSLTKDKQRSLALIEERILPFFDFPTMTRLAVGKAWRDASPAQQAQLTQEFRTLLVRTYAASLDQLREAQIDYRSTPGSSDKRAVVKAVVKRPGMQPLSMEMAVELHPDGWKVYDVAFENLSLVTNYRSDFANVVQRDGINGLVKSLADRNSSQREARQ